MIYGYTRVSTDKQSLKNQRFEIERFAHNNNVKIDIWIEETISGIKVLEKRKLGKLLKKLKKGDILITSELSRLGRNLLQIMSILHHCMNQSAQIWTIKDNYRLGADIQSKVLAFAFALSAEIERNLISQRTKEALARIKAEGRTLGRAVGSKNKSRKLDGKKQKIMDMLRRGMSKTCIAQMNGISRATLYRFIQTDLRSCHKK